MAITKNLIIEEASSGQAAIKRVCDKEKVLPRLIFMDVMMPDMDGYQTPFILNELARTIYTLLNREN